MDGPGQDGILLARRRAGDGAAAAELVRRAGTVVPSPAVAGEVAQEAWLGADRGIGRFEGRSSLSTWIFRTVANVARTRGEPERERERRSVRWTSLSDRLGEGGPPPPPARPGGAPGRGVWGQPPAHWSDQPGEQVLAGSTLERVRAIACQLSGDHQRGLVLRDLRGWSSAEVCDRLEPTEGSQRVLLHRGPSRVRAAPEDELAVPS